MRVGSLILSLCLCVGLASSSQWDRHGRRYDFSYENEEEEVILEITDDYLVDECNVVADSAYIAGSQVVGILSGFGDMVLGAANSLVLTIDSILTVTFGGASEPSARELELRQEYSEMMTGLSRSMKDRQVPLPSQVQQAFEIAQNATQNVADWLQSVQGKSIADIPEIANNVSKGLGRWVQRLQNPGDRSAEDVEEMDFVEVARLFIVSIATRADNMEQDRREEGRGPVTAQELEDNTKQLSETVSNIISNIFISDDGQPQLQVGGVDLTDMRLNLTQLIPEQVSSFVQKVDNAPL